MMVAGPDATRADDRRRLVPGQRELVGRTGAAATSRALVPTTPTATRATGHGDVDGRPRGAFLAQLIATDLQLPQTRARRRAEPADASGCYAAVTPAPTGMVVHRSA